MTGTRKPTAAQMREASKQTPVHHEATTVLRESWSVLNPYGREVHYGSYEDALTAAQTGIY
jgi:hypothetical protein